MGVSWERRVEPGDLWDCENCKSGKDELKTGRELKSWDLGEKETYRAKFNGLV